MHDFSVCMDCTGIALSTQLNLAEMSPRGLAHFPSSSLAVTVSETKQVLEDFPQWTNDHRAMILRLTIPCRVCTASIRLKRWTIQLLMRSNGTIKLLKKRKTAKTRYIIRTNYSCIINYPFSM